MYDGLLIFLVSIYIELLKAHFPPSHIPPRIHFDGTSYSIRSLQTHTHTRPGSHTRISVTHTHTHTHYLQLLYRIDSDICIDSHYTAGLRAQYALLLLLIQCPRFVPTFIILYCRIVIATREITVISSNFFFAFSIAYLHTCTRRTVPFYYRLLVVFVQLGSSEHAHETISYDHIIIK